jgi:hypothetical protein
MHPNHLKRTIQRTLKQIAKQKNKLKYSSDFDDKKAASDELKRLRDKLADLQRQSNE